MEKNNNAHNGVDVCARIPHIAFMPKPITPTKSATSKGYAGRKKRTNLSLDYELTAIAIKYFKTTKYGSLSGFVESKLTAEYRSKAAHLRANKVKLPPSLFEK